MFRINAKRVRASAVALALGVPAAGAIAAPSHYTFVDLGVGTSAHAINSKGAVAGSFAPWLYAPAIYVHGVWHPLSVGDSYGTQALAINNSDDSVYEVYDPIINSINYYQPRKGPFVELKGFAEVTGISDDRVVIGMTYGAGGSSSCLVYKRGITKAIRNVGDSCTPSAINSMHQIVGEANSSAGGTGHAFIWENGVFKFLTDPAGPRSWATGINASGHATVVSLAALASPMLYDGTSTISLPLPPGADSGSSQALNDRDDVVGSWYNSATDASGLFVVSRGQAYDLATLTDGFPAGFTLGFGMGINDSGVIVGTFTVGSSFPPHGFMLVPSEAQQ